jgi:H+-translocating NAD(P) transhydrogenase subunit alpha
MKLAILREVRAGERRVAATPETVERLKAKLGFEVFIESGAGDLAGFPAEAYEKAGATVVANRTELVSNADVVLKVNPPDLEEVAELRAGTTLLCFVWPAKCPELLEALRSRAITALAMDMVPRISRAQKLDALSSMANIAGYRAVIEAANAFGRFFTGQMTAAGKVPPAKVLVIGAGVAGLAAIGAASSLGAIVRAFDTRPAVKDQVKSMGAEFLEITIEEDGTGQGGYAKEMSPAFIAAEMDLFRAQAKEVDIIITTALIPGRPAPKLILADMVELLKPGSVVVDLASEAGGNCEGTVPGQAVTTARGVHILGYTDLPSRMAPTASQLYGMNLVHFLSDIGGAAKWNINLDDEVIRGALVTHGGHVTWPPPPPPKVAEPPKPAAALPVPKAISEDEKAKKRALSSTLSLVLLGAALLGLGAVAPATFVAHLTVFALACFVGWQVVWSVSAALHTPLMSVTNAISGIIIIGGMLQVSGPPGSAVTILGAIAIFFATINIAGGFLVTQRMLKMFTK